MSDKWNELQPCLDRAMALKAAMTLFEWDNETLAPKKAGSLTSEIIGNLSGAYLETMTDKSFTKLLTELEGSKSLSEIQAGILREAREEVRQLESIPPKEYQDYAKLVSEATRIWVKARLEKDFDVFAPTLEKVVDYQIKFASYRALDGQNLYDVMLDSFEKGFDMETLDQFFGQMKETLVPFLKKIVDSHKKIEDGFLTGDYNKEQQEEIAKFLAEYVGFDFDKGVLAVSAHPFTTNLHNHDVRITTHYENKVDSSIFSVIHEAGHGIYELGIRNEITGTLAGQGASMGMHEAQSRFFENIIGRNPAFWKPVYHKLQETFPAQLGQVPLESFVEAVNKVEPGLIRIEADELTYSLHIMIRYELEKQLIKGEIEVKYLPDAWADKYEEYLGVLPDNVSNGVLQDIHWSQGSIGYFPSYALGSAFGAQLYAHMKKEMDFEGLLESGKISVIREYLKEHIHQYGKLKCSRQILKDVTGEDFDPKYYIDYLIEKYSAIYEIS